MDGAIGQEKQDLELLRALRVSQKIEELSKEWSKQSWATEADLRQSLPVSCNDLVNAIDLWVGHVCIYSEAMVDSVDTHMSWNATEAETREHFIRVVRFNNLSYIENGTLVLIVWPHKVE